MRQKLPMALSKSLLLHFLSAILQYLKQQMVLSMCCCLWKTRFVVRFTLPKRAWVYPRSFELSIPLKFAKTVICTQINLGLLLFYFNFLDVNDRLNVFEALKVLERGYDCCSFEKLLNDCSFQMRNKKHVKLVVCGNITHTIDTL